MNARQQVADFLAMVRVGQADVLARQARLQQRRLLRQAAQRFAALGAQGIGHRQAGLMQDIEQFDEERQVGAGAALDQGQDELALLQADEEVAVLAARGYALEVAQATQAIRREKGFQLVTLQGGEYRHIRTADLTGAVLPFKNLPGRNQHVRIVRANEVAVTAVGAHQEVGLAGLGGDFDCIEEAIDPEFLDGLVAFLADGHVRLGGRRIIGIGRERNDSQQADQQQAIECAHGNLVPLSSMVGSV
ncbi:hypothetical protein D3C72_1482550 [compost metagenome]